MCVASLPSDYLAPTARRARLIVLGCGDAFGSGGRMNTCFLIDANARVLIDCGASALIAMKKYGIDPESVEAIVLTHLHGDHFAGIPFLIRETQIAARRTRPLTIIGPPDHERRILAAMDLLFPGSPGSVRFDLIFREYRPGTPLIESGLTVRAWPGVHTAGTNPHAVRIDIDTLSVAYSGDTEWVDDLVDVAADADLFICECYQLTPRARNHIDYETLGRNLTRLQCRKLLLTHMGPDVLAAEDATMPQRAHDGLVIDFA